MAIKRALFNYVSVSRYSSTSLLKTGDKLKQTRIFSTQDLVDYSKVSFDANPLHLDPQYARDAGFSDILVPGMLVASFFPRIIATHFTLNFRSPVYVKEEIVGEVEATSIRGSKNKYMCYNNTGVVVLDGEAMAVLPTLCPVQP
ncbi:putative enoyl-CoA hydratase 2 [Helianthus annuus]|nr:putative enoyl-CoA hydratase 2 [Helianthus annuus]